MPTIAYDRDELIGLVKTFALRFGDFTLASGKKASFYLDCRKVTLHPRGANLIAAGMLDDLERRHGGTLPQAVGGMAIGADPITAALITLAGQRGHDLRGFIVRKESKTHGTGQDVEGPVEAGQSALIVEDTTTTGGSSLKAVEKAVQAGLNVEGIYSVIDRMEGADAAFAEAGLSFACLLTIEDLGIPRPQA